MSDQYSLEDGHDMIVLREAWAKTLERLSVDVKREVRTRFLQPLEPVAIDGETVTLRAPGSFVQEWVKARYTERIERMLGDELGQTVVLELQSEARGKPDAEVRQAPIKTQAAAAAHDRFRPNERYSFDSFVVGDSNRFAMAGARAVADAPGKKYNPLFIYGASGLGKTHLLHAIANELLSADIQTTIRYLTAQQFAEQFVHALQNNKIENFRRQLRSAGVWLVDDVQMIAGRDKTQEELFHTYNTLIDSNKQIVVTSDRPPRDLQLVEERLRSRFEAGLIVDVRIPDTELRGAILLKKAATEGIDLPHEVAMLMAERLHGSVRVLEGALTKVAATASVAERPIDFELAQTVIDQEYSQVALAKPGVEQIVEAVGRQYSISPGEIKGASRKAPITHARHVAVYITREITGDSWKHIGSMFGDKDHSSMMHAHRKIAKMIVRDAELDSTIRGLMRHLDPGQA